MAGTPDTDGRYRVSLERSLRRRKARAARRAARRRDTLAGSLIVLVAVALAGVAASGLLGDGDLRPASATAKRGLEERWSRVAPAAGGPPSLASPQPSAFPSPARMRRARHFAAGRAGAVAFATLGPAGGLRGRLVRRTFVSASVVKAMLLVAYLRAHRGESVAASKAALEPMITVSDNEAADAVYAAVGDAGLYGLAKRAGLRDFSVAGYWANAQLSARDMARFFHRLPRLLRGGHRRYGMRTLAGVAASQRWGIPAAAGRRWRVNFKGGWRGTDLGQLVHQAALLRDRRGGRRLGLAILTDGSPSMGYGVATVRGIAARLLRPRPARP